MIARIPMATKVQSDVSEVITPLMERRNLSVPERMIIVILPSPAGRRAGDEGIVVYLSLSPHPNPLPTGEGNALRHGSSQGSARYSPHQQARNRVYNKRDQEENQSQLNQRTQISIRSRFGEFIRNH